jgi:hypothetical protein
MTLYEKLNAEMQATVDAWVDRLKALDWSRRSDLLTESALSFAEDMPPEKSSLAARGFITAVLERLCASEDGHPGHPRHPGAARTRAVTDTRQALLYLASLDTGHRALAKAYLDAHPEIRDEVARGLAED